MENSDIINDYPPANAIEDKEEKDYPIIRCEDCHEILSISLNIDMIPLYSNLYALLLFLIYYQVLKLLTLKPLCLNVNNLIL